jgi:hypothetical protein
MLLLFISFGNNANIELKKIGEVARIPDRDFSLTNLLSKPVGWGWGRGSGKDSR